jgi:hypothetical protein
VNMKTAKIQIAETSELRAAAPSRTARKRIMTWGSPHHPQGDAEQQGELVDLRGEAGASQLDRGAVRRVCGRLEDLERIQLNFARTKARSSGPRKSSSPDLMIWM